MSTAHSRREGKEFAVISFQIRLIGSYNGVQHLTWISESKWVVHVSCYLQLKFQGKDITQ